MNAEKQLHFDFESVRVCYFDIDLGMSSLKQMGTIFLVESERAKRAKRTHCCTLIEILLYIYI